MILQKIKKVIIKRILAISALLVVLQSAGQTTITIAAAADNTLYENPNTNSNALGENIFSGTNGQGSPRRGLIKFDIAANIPAGATVISASLKLNCNLDRPVPQAVAIHRVLADWGEGTSNAGTGAGDGAGVPATANDATWLTRFFPSTNWTNPGGDFVSAASASVTINGLGFYTWASAGVTADVQAWLNNPASNFGWVLICNESITGTARKFGSRENTTVANRPALDITYTATLPVVITFFKAQTVSDNVILSWHTARETDNDYFDVQHSADGVMFNSIARINGNGTTITYNNYSFTHRNVSKGHQYYRLVQNDINGKQTISRIEKVYIDQTAALFTVFPNPATESISFFNQGLLQNRQYKIVNSVGLSIKTGIVNNNPVPVNNLPGGIYAIMVYDGNKPEGYAWFYKK